MHPDGAFIPRSAPPAFNLHAIEPFFWDGRVVRDAQGHSLTPPLRNVELTAPYGHDGAFFSLREAARDLRAIVPASVPSGLPVDGP